MTNVSIIKQIKQQREAALAGILSRFDSVSFSWVRIHTVMPGGSYWAVSLGGFEGL